jgi:D-alanine transaminase
MNITVHDKQMDLEKITSPEEELTPSLQGSDPLWINGRYTTVQDATIPIEDRSVLFGDGIYEVLAASQGVPVMLEEHLDRWEASARGLRIDQPHDRSTRVKVFRELISRCDAPRVSIYGQLSRGGGRRTHHFPVQQQPVEFWFARPLLPYPAKNYSEGVSVITHPDERWKLCWIKSTSLLANCLAKQAAVEKGVWEAVMVNDDHVVTEGSSSNFYMVKDGIIYTHPTNGRILGGCTRMMLLRLASELGVKVCEEQFTVEQLSTADEAFLTSTTMNIVPVTTIDGAPVGDGRVGRTVSKLMKAMNLEIQNIVAMGW